MLAEFTKIYNPFQQLIATVLSARTKDKTTIPIAKKLFETIKKPEDILRMPDDELQRKIYGIGFYKEKTKRLKELCCILKDEYKNQIPNEVNELLKLPGVGRKTACCVAGYTFGKPCIAVDVHVHRISNRLGAVKTKTTTETEQELMRILPEKYWLDVNELLVAHGQKTCVPISPFCTKCPVNKLCKKTGVSHSR